MKKRVEAILTLAAFEAIHFIILTAMLCGIGFFTRDDGTAVTFRQLLWQGGVSFWFGWYGAALLLCLLIVTGGMLLNFFADQEALENRRKGMDKEVLAAAQRLLDKRLPELEASIKAACERELVHRKQILAEEEKRLSIRQWEQGRERQKLNDERAELDQAKGKIAAWKTELAALRRKAEADKEKPQALKQCIRWAQGALAEEPPNAGLARRHLKKAEKMWLAASSCARIPMNHSLLS